MSEKAVLGSVPQFSRRGGGEVVRRIHEILCTFWNSKLLSLAVFWGGGGVRQPPVGQGLLIHEVSRSHTTTHHSRYDFSVRVISLSQRHLPDNTQHSLQRETDMPPVGFSRREAADLGLRPRSQWDRHSRLGSSNAIHCTPITSWPEVGLCRVLLNHLMEIIEYCFAGHYQFLPRP